mmetsp:Transcript_28810/g.54768  ORF Transcript_28810/g.54768 Transcript_28810/m.54768 type:complete len:238 (+) Transcript_28810:1354-2067(+)
MFADVGQQKRNTTTTFGELQRRVDATPDAFHVVFQTQQEAGDQLPPRGFAGVQESRRRGLKPPFEDFLHKRHRQRFVAARKRQGCHHNAIFIAFEEPLPITCFERVGGVILECAKEGWEAEFLRIGLIPDLAHEVLGVLIQHRLFIVALFDKVAELFVKRVEEHCVLVDVLQEILPRRHAVRVKSDFAVPVIKVQHRVQCVIIQSAQLTVEHRLSPSFCSPSVTRAISVSVPASSNV